jgi:hypothetical protein
VNSNESDVFLPLFFLPLLSEMLRQRVVFE